MSAIQEAKRKLPLPALLHRLGLGEHAKKSARCPFHDDQHNSFSVWKNGDGVWAWKCHAGCGQGDEITFLELHRSILRSEATKLFLEMAELSGSSRTVRVEALSASLAVRQRVVADREVSHGSSSFDWQLCVNALKHNDRVRLGNERWYSRAFVDWLHGQSLVGLYQGQFAFPVHDRAGKVVAAHFKHPDGVWWLYHPTGTKTRPLVIGELVPGEAVHPFESTWDGLAFMDVSGERSGIIITRGASNAALAASLVPESSTVYLWTQNDPAGEKWQQDLCAKTKATVKRVKIPAPHKDLNDWTEAGATDEDLLDAMLKAEILRKPEHADKGSSGGCAENSADDEEIARLAALPALEYDRIRQKKAKELRCRVSTLDAEVAAKRPQSSDEDTLQGAAVDLADVELWPKAVNGAEVLDAIAGRFSRYVVQPQVAAHTTALWCAHTHVFELFQCSPRLNISSPEKNCGKSTLRDVVALFVPRSVLTENMTPAVLFRLVHAQRPTILADECDKWLLDNQELCGLFNAGHRRGAKAYRCEGDGNEVRGFAAYAPAVLCGIGSLPGTLHDRSVVVRLERAERGEIATRFDSRHVEEELELSRKLARWCADNRIRIEACDPKLPEGAVNRLGDNWRPLFAIAEVAGGSWPQRVQAAFMALTTTADLDAQGIGALLLSDIAALFAAEKTNKLPSSTITESLAAIEGRPWAEWGRQHRPISVNQLANQLRRFGVSPRKFRIGEETFRGYLLGDFREAFARYLLDTLLPEWNNGTTLGEWPVSRVEQADLVFNPGNEGSQRECSTVPPCAEGEEEDRGQEDANDTDFPTRHVEVS